jgi:hypothetical protein
MCASRGNVYGVDLELLGRLASTGLQRYSSITAVHRKTISSIA